MVFFFKKELPSSMNTRNDVLEWQSAGTTKTSTWRRHHACAWSEHQHTY